MSIYFRVSWLFLITHYKAMMVKHLLYIFSFLLCTTSVYYIINRLRFDLSGQMLSTISSAACSYTVCYVICYRMCWSCFPLLSPSKHLFNILRQMCILVNVTFKIYTIHASEAVNLCIITNMITIYNRFYPLLVVNFWLKHTF